MRKIDINEELVANLSSVSGLPSDYFFDDVILQDIKNASENSRELLERARRLSLVNWLNWYGIRTSLSVIDRESVDEKILDVIAAKLFLGTRCFVESSDFIQMAEGTHKYPEIFMDSTNDARIIFILKQDVIDKLNYKISEEADVLNWNKNINQERRIWIDKFDIADQVREVARKKELFTNGMPILPVSARTATVTSYLIQLLEYGAKPVVVVWSEIGFWNHSYFLHSGRHGNDGMKALSDARKNHERFFKAYSDLRGFQWRNSNLTRFNSGIPGGGADAGRAKDIKRVLADEMSYDEFLSEDTKRRMQLDPTLDLTRAKKQARDYLNKRGIKRK